MNDKLHKIETLLAEANELLEELDIDDVDELGLTKTLGNVAANTRASLTLMSVCRYRLDDAGAVH